MNRSRTASLLLLALTLSGTVPDRVSAHREVFTPEEKELLKTAERIHLDALALTAHGAVDPGALRSASTPGPCRGLTRLPSTPPALSPPSIGIFSMADRNGSKTTGACKFSCKIWPISGMMQRPSWKSSGEPSSCAATGVKFWSMIERLGDQFCSTLHSEVP